jgi:hypothetical protein
MSASNNLPNSSSHPMGQSTLPALDQLLEEVGTANPQELLGAGARTSLGMAMIQATAVVVLFLVGFTVGPYLLSTPAGDNRAKPEPVPQEEAKVEPKEPAKTKPTAPAAPVDPKTAVTAKDPPVSKDALNKLGVNETKKADPSLNPLDKGNDDLLKDLDKK